MTLPMERINAIRNAKNFLYSLLDPQKTPKIPSVVRKEARRVLKHYPMEVDMHKWVGDAMQEESTLFARRDYEDYEDGDEEVPIGDILARIDRAIQETSTARAGMHEMTSEPLHALLQAARDEIIKLGVRAYLTSEETPLD
jgi:hypothetical protein